MKVKSALEDSKFALKLSTPLVLLFAVLAIKYPSPLTIVPLLALAFSWVGDVINIWSIRRKASRNPAYLDDKVE